MGVKYSNYYVRTVKEATLKIADVEKMVLDGILLVHPKLVTVEGRRCMFMRPSRFFPSKMKTQDVINLLQYMTQRLTEDIRTQFTGFTFVADLGNWKMANFSQSYAFTWFLTMLVMPVRMENFIIIDAPPWFGAIWAIIRSAMSQSFREKWTYVTRATIDTVLAPEHRFADIADGTLEVDLAQWCEDRRVAELNIKTPFRSPDEHIPQQTLIRKMSTHRGSRSNSASASPVMSPKKMSLSSNGLTPRSSVGSQEEEFDSGLSEAMGTCSSTAPTRPSLGRCASDDARSQCTFRTTAMSWRW